MFFVCIDLLSPETLQTATIATTSSSHLLFTFYRHHIAKTSSNKTSVSPPQHIIGHFVTTPSGLLNITQNTPFLIRSSTGCPHHYLIIIFLSCRKTTGLVDYYSIRSPAVLTDTTASSTIHYYCVCMCVCVWIKAS